MVSTHSFIVTNVNTETNDVGLHFLDVELNGTWTTHGMDVHISNCSLSGTTFVIKGFPGNIARELTVQDSVLGQLEVSDMRVKIQRSRARGGRLTQPLIRVERSEVTIEECNFENVTLLGDASLFSSSHSNARISNSVFRHNHGGTMMHSAHDSHVTISTCLFEHNSEGPTPESFASVPSCSVGSATNCRTSGGAISVKNSTCNITRSRFLGNRAGCAGAVSVSNESRLFLTNSSFAHNMADVDAGGAVVIRDHSVAMVTQCLFTNNTATNVAGAILIETNSKGIIVGSRFEGNAVESNRTRLAPGPLYEIIESSGGAIGVKTASNVSVSNSVFQGNMAGIMGGAIFLQESRAEVNSSVFLGNTAQNYGGAIRATQASIYVTSCAFHSNRANDGGALHSYKPGNLTVTHSAFINNTAKRGGTLYARNKVIVTFSNCSFRGETTLIDEGILTLKEDVVAKLEDTNFTHCVGLTLQATLSTNINVQRCSFTGNVGPLLECGQSKVAIDGSWMKDNVIKSSDFISITGEKSSVDMRNTILSNNAMAQGAERLTLARLNQNRCRLTMSNCTYTHNSALKHFVAQNASIVFKKCNIVSNKGDLVYARGESDLVLKDTILRDNQADYSVVFFVEASTFYAEGCTIDHNRAEREILYCNHGNATLVDTSLNYNKYLDVLVRMYGRGKSFLQLIGCVAISNVEQGNGASLASNATDVNIQNSYFGNMASVNLVLIVECGNVIRIGNTTFSNYILAFLESIGHPCGSSLYTYDVTIEDRNVSLQSHSSDFLQAARCSGVIANTTRVVHQETHFASRE